MAQKIARPDINYPYHRFTSLERKISEIKSQNEILVREVERLASKVNKLSGHQEISQYDFSSFVEKNFLTADDAKQLNELSLSLPISSLIRGYSKYSLHGKVFSREKNDYLNQYFKSISRCFTTGKSIWDLENLPEKEAQSLIDEQKALLSCLNKANLISRLTYDKILNKITLGQIYAPWEVLEFASILTENEEKFKTSKLKEEVRKLHYEGLISLENLFDFEDNLINEINQISDLLFKYNIGRTLNKSLFEPFSPFSVQFALESLFLFLPFHESHEIGRVEYKKFPLHAENPNGIYHSCLIEFTFNDEHFAFPFSVGNFAYKIGDNFDFRFISHIIHSLCEHFKSEKTPCFVVNSFLDSYDKCRNFESFTLLMIPQKLQYRKKINMNLFGPIILGFHGYITTEDKLNYLQSIIDSFNPARFKNIEIDELKEKVLSYEIEFLGNILSLLPNFYYEVWKDDVVSYQRIFNRLETISLGNFKLENITEQKNGDYSLVTVWIDKKEFSINLYNRRIDYDFCQLLDEIQTTVNLNGKFYTFSPLAIEDGHSFIFLENEEHEKIKENNLFSSHAISTVQNYWIDKS